MSEPVQVKRVSLPEDILARLFTMEKAKKLTRKGVYTYGLLQTEKNNLMGGCVFSFSDEIPMAVCLEELFVNEDYRGNRYGEKLLETATKELKKIGIKYILYKKAAEDADEVLDSFNYAIKNDFVPYVIDEKILYYDIVNLLGKNFENKEMDIEKDFDRVCRFMDLSGEEVIRFNEKKDHGFYEIRLKTFDEKLTHFYMNKGEIEGVAKAVRDGTKAILNNIYLKPAYDRIEAFTALFLKFVMAAARDESIELVVIQTVGNERNEAVKKILGRPHAEYPATELVKYL